MDEKKTPPTQDALIPNVEEFMKRYQEAQKGVESALVRQKSDECQCDRTPRCPCCGKKLPFGTSWQYNYGPTL